MKCATWMFCKSSSERKEATVRARGSRLHTRVKGGEKETRWFNERASNSRELALLSFQPCHRKTNRPRLSFCALTPVSSLVLSLPPPLCALSPSLYMGIDGPFRTQPANQPSGVHTHIKHTYKQKEGEREKNWTTGARKHATGCWCGSRGKRVYMRTNMMTIRSLWLWINVPDKRTSATWWETRRNVMTKDKARWWKDQMTWN